MKKKLSAYLWITWFAMDEDMSNCRFIVGFYFHGLAGFMGLVGFMGLWGLMGLGPSNPPNPSIPLLLSSIPAHPLLAGAVHLLFDATLLLEVVLLPFNQPADEHIALVDEGDGNVGNGFGRALLDLFAIDGRVEVPLAEDACLHASGVIEGPLLEASHTEEIFVVEQQFVQRSTVYVCQFYFHFARRHTIDISLRQILLTRAGRLHHLVNRAVARLQEFMCKVVRYIVDALRLLECLQCAVIIVLSQEIFVLVHSFTNGFTTTDMSRFITIFFLIFPYHIAYRFCKCSDNFPKGKGDGKKCAI